ncbi:hypothetical protein [Kutzneria sp. NPDC052558]|uniref:nSTAND1 domain-containing NTPase n=1 Tax=Kutzneria sp. NPDC052558 TaxID=3364121 RepID=UPI0037CC8616
MPRSEQPLGSGDDPITSFARDLRKLRADAGSPTYRELGRRTHYSASTLAEAASGKRLPSLAATLAYVRACGGDTGDWERRWHSIVAADRVDPPESDERAPYVGLAAFQAEDADRFFGREELVEQLLARVATQRFLAVFGASGAGKSSILRAGLVAGRNDAPVLLFTPGRHPVEECAIRLAAWIGWSSVSLRTELAADPEALHLHVRQALADRDDNADLLIVVDQFEEVFTLCQDPAEREQFLAALLHAARARTSQVRVVLGVRTDFYTHCAAHPELVAALQDAQVLVGPMTAEQLRSAISRPAVDAGFRLENALMATIMAETAGELAVLPLVSHALLETWRRRQGTTLTLASYHAAGGIADAIARTAEGTYAEFDATQQALARDLFLRLTALGDGTEDTKRRVYRRELDTGPDLEFVVERLTQARLVAADRDGLEITHEALIRSWPRLRGWLSDDRDSLRIHRALTDATDTWESLDRDPAALYRGVRLDQATTWAADGRAALTAREQEFVQASVRARDEEESRTRRRTRRLRQLVAAVVVFAVLATSAAAVAFQQWSTAIHQRDDAVFAQVLAEGDRLRDGDPSLSAQLDLVADRLRPNDPDVRTRLLGTESAPLAVSAHGHTGEVYLTSFSPDGKTLATASEDHTARLWDVHDPTRPTPLGKPLTGHTSWVSSAVFSPDGHTLATAGDDHTVRLWDVSDPANAKPIGGPLDGGGTIYLVAFSPDGKTLAAASEDHTVHLWHVADPAHPAPLGQPLAGHTGPVRSVAFSPDGRLLAAGSDDATILLWNVADPAQPTRVGPALTGHSGIVHSVAFSPDSAVLASGSDDRTIRLWTVADGSELGDPLTGHTAAVWSVEFSPDGHVLASGSDDSTARLWNVSDPARAVPLGSPLASNGHVVFAVGFSPDGRTLATGSADSVVRLWSLPTAMIGSRSAVNSTAFSPDGHLLAAGANDNTVRLWNTADPRAPQPLGQIPATPGYLQSCSECATAVAFSPDGKVLAVLSYAKIAQLWDVSDPAKPRQLGPTLVLDTRYSAFLAFSPDGRTLATSWDDQIGQLWDVSDPGNPKRLGQLPGHTSYINSAAFSPDGRYLATGSSDRTIRLWDVTDRSKPKPLSQLPGHTSGVNSVAFSPDGQRLASASTDQTVRLWDVTDPARPKQTGQLTGHSNGVLAVSFSPDGRTMASAGTDQTIRLWDTENPGPLGQPISTLGGTAFSVPFRPDGAFLATADGANGVRLLDLNADHAVRRICASTRGLMTEKLWQEHLPELPYDPPCSG